MKILTVKQPWASLIATGAKQIETRSWLTSYRGPLAIHASKKFSRENIKLALEEPFLSVWRKAGIEKMADLPLGCVIAVAELVDCAPTERISFDLGRARQEKAFGDYSPGRFAWILNDVRPLKEPTFAKGALGLWDWEPPEGVTL